MARLSPLLLFVSGWLGLIAAVPAQADPQPRAVLELFTSQGCSSCPPADALAGSLAGDPTLIVLTWPVDIWDYLGWKDTLARPDFTARQRAYADARGDRAVYTPQMIVNGLDHVVGSAPGKIDAALEVHARKFGVLPVGVDLAVTGDQVQVRIAAAPGGQSEARSATVWLIPIKRRVTVPIARGENSGHAVTYTHVVRGVQSVGMWSGQAMSIDLPASELSQRDADGCVVLLQVHKGGKPGRIIGAALLRMAGS